MFSQQNKISKALGDPVQCTGVKRICRYISFK